ncbi:hypothetical protein J1N35_033381 [Gossypium stocksii]|uniref:Uncharacterized protein n=1 Tax=Gossypium stocksii TaxID=47602 RepID=A0A9D3UQA2_9ROSI|nr:hypothetical protein J1N35_033381 [Gossypium stocksii]
MRSSGQWPTDNDDDAEVRWTGEADRRGELGGMADRQRLTAGRRGLGWATDNGITPAAGRGSFNGSEIQNQNGPKITAQTDVRNRHKTKTAKPPKSYQKTEPSRLGWFGWFHQNSAHC